MNKLIKPGRLAFFLFFVTVLCAVYVVFLYKLQIVEGAEYYEESQNSIVTTQTVTGARGNIMDRYGRLLVSNTACNNLIIDDVELFNQPDPNAVILELARTAEACGDGYTDTLPITKEAPFEYVPRMSDLQRTLLDAYIANAQSYWSDYALPENPTAVELMAFFRQRYKIDNSYGSEEMRIIAGIRYEINIRHIINTADYIFVQDASMELITKLMENAVPGFDVTTSYVREYRTSCAAHLLGYVGPMNEKEFEVYKEKGYSLNAHVGKDGAELAFEDYLHGKDGVARVTSTSTGTLISKVYTKEPEPGDNVYLTIDIGLQEAAEQALNSFITQANAAREENNKTAVLTGKNPQELISGGAVAAVSVKTGEPLCLASYPTYDLSTFLEDYSELLEDPNAPLFNRALMGTYAPGSTFKPCTAVAIMNEGIITPATTLTDEGIFTKYKEQNYAPKCWIYPGNHGTINVAQAITVSCNYFFYHFGDLLGVDKLSHYAAGFGLGEKTGIELPEALGQMSTQAYKEQLEGLPWYAGDTLQAAIGQAYSQFTPLQLANYTAAIANNGTRYSCSMLKSVRSYNFSEKIYEREPEVAGSVLVDQSYYDAVHQGMWGLTNDKSNDVYGAFADCAVQVACKTGTAQLGEDRMNNAVFVCYAPYEDPEIAVAVVVEKGGAGSSVARIARDVIDSYFSFKNSYVAPEAELTLLR